MNKEYLRINDMLKKLGVSKRTFYKMRKNGDIPKPVIKSPIMWMNESVDEFYRNKTNKNDK